MLLMKYYLERKNEAVGKSHEPYVPKKLNELNLPVHTQDDLSPGQMDVGQINGADHRQIFNPISTSAHLLNGKTITNNHTSSHSNYKIFEIIFHLYLNFP